MAGSVLSNLYPGIIDTYMPAFINTKTCKVYFSISQYNTYSEVKSNAQITVKNQNSNKSVLKTSLYPNGIKITNVQIDADKDTDDKYYIEIEPSDLINGFELNQYYKVQIRFTDSSIAGPAEGAEGTWLAANTAYFSEWSTVCLIRGISQPVVSVNAFQSTTENASMVLTNTHIDFVGTVSFEDSSETELLKSYRVRLYDTANNLLQDSGDQYTSMYNDLNQINYTLKYELVDGDSYVILLDITTKNLYSQQNEYDFTVIQRCNDTLDATIDVTTDEELGCCTVTLSPTTTDKFAGNVTIRRTDSRSNFTIWEDVHNEVIDDEEPITLTWKDFTIECGIWYKYCAQSRDSFGNRGIALVYQAPVICMFEDVFLGGSNTQLRIKYNPSISSYKRTITEARTDTIGSQYPFIKRNGYTNYRQFPISGLITFFDDYADTFTSRTKIFGEDIIPYYDDLNEERKINPWTDRIYEREFREKVMDFLYADEVRLFRSMTEGNMLIRLMDVNLSPEEALGRQLYSFSATAYEVDDCTVENIDSYGVQEIGDYSTAITFSTVTKGQVQQTFNSGAGNDIITKVLQDKYTNVAPDGFIAQIQYLSNLRIEFNMAPYLIKETSTGTLTKLGANEVPDSTTALGYIAYINNIAVLIGPEGIYELGGNGIKVTSLYFPAATTATIDYIANINEVQDTSQFTQWNYFSNRIGQIWGKFDYQDSVFNRILTKYYQSYSTYYQKLISVNGVRIETNPNTVVWIKESKDTALERHVINDTGTLEIYDDDSIIEGMYFSGYHLEEATEEDLRREQIPYNKFVETGLTIDDPSAIDTPVMNGVYTITKKSYGFTAEEIPTDTAGTPVDETELIADHLYALLLEEIIDSTNRYIYFEGKWKLFTDTNDILCDVDAVVDYICEIMKGVYAA